MRLTAAGIFFLTAGAMLVVAAYRFAVPGFLPVGILLIFLVAISLIFALLAGARMRAVATAATKTVRGIPVARVGQDLDVRVRLMNSLPLPVSPFYLEIEGGEGFGTSQGVRVPGMNPSGAITVDAVFTPAVRGMRGIRSVTIALEGPFGLATSRRTVLRDVDIAVAPPDLRLAAPNSTDSARQNTDSPRIRRGMQTRDFHTREYVPGDDLRHVHWGTTARVGELVVRQEADENQPAAAVIVHAPDAEDDVRFDMLMAAALSAVTSFAHADYDVFATFGSRQFTVTDRSDLTLAQLEAARAAPEEAARVSRTDLRQCTEIVTCSLDPDREPALPAVRRSRIHRWHLSDIPEDTVNSLQFSGMFGGDFTYPDRWTLRGAVRS